MSVGLRSAADTYTFERRIGSGSFGEVFAGVDRRNGDEVAVKVESSQAKTPKLMQEAKIYKGLNGRPGFAKLRHCSMEARRNVLVVDLLGASLDEVFNLCGRRFSFKTVCMLGEQIVERLENLHELGWIHRDLKPGNLLLGPGGGEESSLVHLIDFGLAKRFRDSAGQHIDFKQTKTVKGTFRYCSLNASKANEQSRRDDLEALGLVLVYFLRGELPWQGPRKAFTRRVQLETLVQAKESTSLVDLCSDLDGGEVLLEYLNYCRRLDFKECPDYNYLRRLFADAMEKRGEHFDMVFDWVQRASPCLSVGSSEASN